MRDLERKYGEVERGEVFEMPTEANRERREMSASPTGAGLRWLRLVRGLGGGRGRGDDIGFRNTPSIRLADTKFLRRACHLPCACHFIADNCSCESVSTAS